MRSSRRSRLSAVAVFLLLAIVVVGNLGWATMSSYKLAEERVTEDYERRVTAAVWELNSYMAGVLNSETARAHLDYVRSHRAIPLVAYSTVQDVELDNVSVLLPSPLASSDPPYEWIDLYFQLARNTTGTEIDLHSPQIPDARSPWPIASASVYPYARPTFDWLLTILPDIDLSEHVARVCTIPREVTPSSADLESIDANGPVSSLVAPASDRLAKASPDRQSRKQQSLRAVQLGHLPPSLCVEAWIADPNLRNDYDAGDGTRTDGSDEIEITADPIATPFWLGEGPNGSEKLAFVRECHWGEGVFFQGFVGDWDRLKPNLLAEISDRFPQAGLTPIYDYSEIPSETFSAAMTNLPVRLSVPDIRGGAAAVAWQSVRSTLITMWLAAVAVLAVSGWGLRNLVKLTERRMQFAYSVTHELRTPLTTFRLYSDMLSAGMVPEDSKQEYLDTLNRESLRLSKLVEGVLEYARLENQKVRLNTSETDPTSLLGVVAETLENRCAENNVRAQTENTMVNGDTIRTDIDVVNRIAGVLVNNACRHARGTERAQVLLRVGADDGKIHIDVIDSGPGIDRADARAIFKPFRRGRRAEETAQRGIGLGLALASSWAELLGGRLTLAARHDPKLGGAHFRLTIPARLDA